MEPFLADASDHPLLWLTATQLLLEAGRVAEARTSFLRVMQGLSTYQGGQWPALELRWALTLWGRHHANEGAFPDAGWFLRQACEIPERPAEAGPPQLDLTRHFNVSLRFAWNRPAGTHWDFRDLPVGVTVVGGIGFDVRGAIVLASRGGSYHFGDLDIPAPS
ncbi:MAG: hypothetical protein M5U12_23070 [Verrucomicrobia bacterium]|nr:hypothetical protein [Verrucomicrobiota bacterium]